MLSKFLRRNFTVFTIWSLILLAGYSLGGKIGLGIGSLILLIIQLT